MCTQQRWPRCLQLFFRNRDMLEKTRWIFSDKLIPILFTSTAQQINRTCIKSLFEPSSSIRLQIKELLGELLNGSLLLLPLFKVLNVKFMINYNSLRHQPFYNRWGRGVAGIAMLDIKKYYVRRKKFFFKHQIDKKFSIHT